MKIAVSGASGFIGSHLVRALESQGHQVFRLVRRSAGSANEIAWSANAPPQVSGLHAVVHLAGESIMGRWTPEKKARIRDSRVTGTHALATALASAEVRPKSFVVASAIGYYGPQGDKVLTEDSAAGSDYLAQVAREWEAATEPAREAGARVVNLRIGVVLSPEGGALKQMLTPFRVGVGGRIGPGTQWMSWVALEDVIGVTVFALENESLAGPVNVVAPNPVTNAEFTRTLGRTLHRPTLFPVPVFVVKMALGEMGEALLLGSQRVVPEKLQASGYRFTHGEIEEALRAMLEKKT